MDEFQGVCEDQIKINIYIRYTALPFVPVNGLPLKEIRQGASYSCVKENVSCHCLQCRLLGVSRLLVELLAHVYHLNVCHYSLHDHYKSKC